MAGTWLNSIGAILRLLASLAFSGDSRYWVAMVGQIVSACSQPLVLSMPTKLAALWFGDNERTIANTMASLGIPILIHGFNNTVSNNN